MEIEEKAKAYDNAIKVIKDNLDALNEITETGANTVNIQSIINCFYRAFPELKKTNKNEKIKESIKKVLANTDFKRLGIEYSFYDMINWLEKQGEHANFLNKIQVGDKVTRNEDGVLVNLSQLKRVAKSEFNPDDLIEESYQQQADDLIDMVTEKPVWSKEDEYIMEEIEAIIDAYVLEENDPKALKNWLKSLKDYVQPQPEQKWKEEDEIGFGDTLWAINKARTIAKDENDMGNLWYAENWLKELKERIGG